MAGDQDWKMSPDMMKEWKMSKFVICRRNLMKPEFIIMSYEGKITECGEKQPIEKAMNICINIRYNSILSAIQYI